ncbi:hypothetical protein CI610_02365 [invertebrate metagenome]|uniref:Uncharacterized protein n=1 Tax=invertebrate metagenome TaxID=1711999 RepID=A0A2H9T637_9ZZZZ
MSVCSMSLPSNIKNTIFLIIYDLMLFFIVLMMNSLALGMLEDDQKKDESDETLLQKVSLILDDYSVIVNARGIDKIQMQCPYSLITKEWVQKICSEDERTAGCVDLFSKQTWAKKFFFQEINAIDAPELIKEIEENMYKKQSPDEIGLKTIGILKNLQSPLEILDTHYSYHDATECQEYLKDNLGVQYDVQINIIRAQALGCNTMDRQGMDCLLEIIEERGGVPFIMEGYAGSGHLAKYMNDHGYPVFAVDDCSQFSMKRAERHCGNVFHADVFEAFSHFSAMILKLKTHIENVRPYVMIMSPNGCPEKFRQLLLALSKSSIPLILCATENFHSIAGEIFEEEEMYRNCAVFKGAKVGPDSVEYHLPAAIGCSIRYFLCIYTNHKYTERWE